MLRTDFDVTPYAYMPRRQVRFFASLLLHRARVSATGLRHHEDGNDFQSQELVHVEDRGDKDDIGRRE